MATIPIVDSIAAIYGEHAGQEKYVGAPPAVRMQRYHDLVKTFQAAYHRSPEFIARAPGRVNIIDIDSTRLEWSNYFKCGYKGAHQYLKRSEIRGMECLVEGNIPTGAGLSSSSAFVSCAAIATLMAQSASLDKRMITEIAIRSERYVGVNSGGMDQACSIMTNPQSASFIEFHPHLKVTPVAFPQITPALTFVMADSLVSADKLVSAPTCYNLRVVETRLGALVLSKFLNLQPRPRIRAAHPLTYKLIMDEYFSQQAEQLQLNTATQPTRSPVEIWEHRLQAMLQCLTRAFRQVIPVDGAIENGVAPIAIAQYLGLPWEQLAEVVEMDKYPVQATTFQLYRRARHVYSEALRVVRFRATCESFTTRVETESTGPGPNSSPVQTLYQTLGQFMNQSHESCRDDFDCSCPELDTLVGICRAAGAVGSRLTGAGWGGYTVSLVPGNQVTQFMEQVTKQYYESRLSAADLRDKAAAILFASQPGHGAMVLRLPTKG
ncbi:galactokinase [Dimargaris verticillata]|uniref:Galactokinase n=1 Tax=Dimargaris verticillata TaxID=2761393 RepID=A0A9W8B1R4_9FUNG|nr:galactokinase [Dimargaris verticillata]